MKNLVFIKNFQSVVSIFGNSESVLKMSNLIFFKKKFLYANKIYI